MRCHICGTEMIATITDLPFKINQDTIVIVKGLPVDQCRNCGEYSLDDPVMARVDRILARVEPAAELEIIRYAA